MVFRITPRQRAKIKTLVRRTCCNCCKGNCLLLDDGEESEMRAAHFSVRYLLQLFSESGITG